MNKLKNSNYFHQKLRKQLVYKPVTFPQKKIERMQKEKKKEPLMLPQKKVERMQKRAKKEPVMLSHKKVERMHIGINKEVQIYKENKKPLKSLEKSSFHSSQIETPLILPNFLSIPYDVPKIQ